MSWRTIALIGIAAAAGGCHRPGLGHHGTPGEPRPDTGGGGQQRPDHPGPPADGRRARAGGVADRAELRPDQPRLDAGRHRRRRRGPDERSLLRRAHHPSGLLEGDPVDRHRRPGPGRAAAGQQRRGQLHRAVPQPGDRLGGRHLARAPVHAGVPRPGLRRLQHDRVVQPADRLERAGARPGDAAGGPGGRRSWTPAAQQLAAGLGQLVERGRAARRRHRTPCAAVRTAWPAALAASPRAPTSWTTGSAGSPAAPRRWPARQAGFARDARTVAAGSVKVAAAARRHALGSRGIAANLRALALICGRHGRRPPSAPPWTRAQRAGRHGRRRSSGGGRAHRPTSPGPMPASPPAPRRSPPGLAGSRTGPARWAAPGSRSPRVPTT